MIKLKELLESNNDYFKTAGEAVEFARKQLRKRGLILMKMIGTLKSLWVVNITD